MPNPKWPSGLQVPVLATSCHFLRAFRDPPCPEAPTGVGGHEAEPPPLPTHDLAVSPGLAATSRALSRGPGPVGLLGEARTWQVWRGETPDLGPSSSAGGVGVTAGHLVSPCLIFPGTCPLRLPGSGECLPGPQRAWGRWPWGSAGGGHDWKLPQEAVRVTAWTVGGLSVVPCIDAIMAPPPAQPARVGALRAWTRRPWWAWATLPSGAPR